MFIKCTLISVRTKSLQWVARDIKWCWGAPGKDAQTTDEPKGALSSIIPNIYLHIHLFNLAHA